MIRRYTARRVVPALLAVLTGLGGCAINPYIKVERPTVDATGSPSVLLGRSVDYANRVIDAYAAMPSAEFDRQQAIAATLIFGTAGVIGAAAGNAHRDVYLVTGLAGGTLYQTANWNSSAGRQALFIEGRKSLVCAKAGLAPLGMSDKALVDLEDRIKDTEKLARKANAAAGNVVGWLALAPRVEAKGAPSTLVAAAEAELVKHQTRIENLNRVIGQAAGGANLTRSAGQLLEAHVDSVRAAIDGGLNDTIASLKNLDQALKGTASAANLILAQAGQSLPMTTGAAATTVTKALADGVVTAEDDCMDPVTGKAVACPQVTRTPEVGLAMALRRLSAASADLDTAAESLKKLSPMALEKMQAGIALCNPDIAKSMKPLGIAPASASVDTGTAEAFFIRISGGTTPYGVTPLTALPAGVSVLSQPSGVSITVNNSAVPGSYQLQVSDAADATATFTLTVRPKTAAAPATPLDAEKNKTLKPDSKKNPGAGGNLAPTAPAPGAPAAPTANQQVCAAIPAGKTCGAAGARCEFECGQSTAQISAIRGRLGLERTPASFDTDLREKLLQFQKGKGLTANGEYNPATAGKLFP